MIGTEKPLLTIIMRASEIVTRLPWDLLLSIRIGEYVYGHNQFSIEIIMRSAFADDISLMLYNGYEPIEPLIAKIPNEERRKRLKKTLKKVKRAADDGEDPGYQAYMRVYKIFNPEKYGKTPTSLLAKDCIIGDWDGIPMPKNGCPSITVRNQIKKVYLKFIEKYNLDIFAEADTSRKVIKFKESDGSITEDLSIEEDDDDNSNE